MSSRVKVAAQLVSGAPEDVPEALKGKIGGSSGDDSLMARSEKLYRESSELYAKLLNSGEEVRKCDFVKALGVSKPTAYALLELSKRGLIEAASRSGNTPASYWAHVAPPECEIDVLRYIKLTIGRPKSRAAARKKLLDMGFSSNQFEASNKLKNAQEALAVGKVRKKESSVSSRVVFTTYESACSKALELGADSSIEGVQIRKIQMWEVVVSK